MRQTLNAASRSKAAHEKKVSDIRFFIIIAAFFVTGAVVGIFAGSGINGQTGMTAKSLVADFFYNGNNFQAVEKNFFQVLLKFLAFPVLAFLFGTSFLGIFATPLLLGARGFYLGYASAALWVVLGDKSKTVILASLGTSSAIAIPALFVISIASMRASRNLLSVTASGKQYGAHTNRSALLSYVLCFAVIFAAALLDTYLTPFLLSITL